MTKQEWWALTKELNVTYYNKRGGILHFFVDREKGYYRTFYRNNAHPDCLNKLVHNWFEEMEYLYD